MAAKPLIQPTGKLGHEDSRELVRNVFSVTLSDSRRATLKSYALEAQRAFAKRTNA